MAKLDYMQIEGTKYEIVPEIAPLFNTSTAYAVGDCVIKDAVLYRFKAAHAAGAWVGTDADEIKVGDELTDIKADINEKASSNGTYENMTAGNAEQLLSDEYAEDKVPYLFRQSGGGVDVGDRAEDTIVGGSVAWNQMIRSFVTPQTSGGVTTTFSDGVFSCSGTASGTFTAFARLGPRVVENHKYLGRAIILENPNNVSFYIATLGGTDSNPQFNLSPTQRSRVLNSSKTINAEVNFGLSGLTTNTDMSGIKFVVIFTDLTTLFGSSTIPDYVYSLEQSTSGSGIAWLRQCFPTLFEYHEYDAGTLKHVEGLVSHDMVGFNQFDKTAVTANTWLSDVDGTTASQSNYNVSDFIPILPNTAYYKSDIGSGRNLYYDANKVALPNQTWNSAIGSGQQVLTTPTNAHFIRFTVTNAYLDSLVFNLSWDGSRNGEYEEYELHSYQLDSDLVLRGIPKLDANNKLYYDGDIYEPDGTVTRRYGVVDLGTLTWSLSNSTNFFYASISGIKQLTTSVDSQIVCGKYSVLTVRQTAGMEDAADKTIAQRTSSNQIMVRDTAYSTAEAFKTAMSGVYLVYELATSTTEEADPYTTPQIVDEYGTEEYVIDDSIIVPVPVGHDTKYPVNLKAKIEGLPWNFATLIAPTEATYTASRAYTTGQLFIVNNILYQATANIANGGAITPNTNCTATTLAEVISAL